MTADPRLQHSPGLPSGLQLHDEDGKGTSIPAPSADRASSCTQPVDLLIDMILGQKTGRQIRGKEDENWTPKAGIGTVSAAGHVFPDIIG